MPSAETMQRRLREIEELARGWGKILAQEAFPEGVGLDVDLFTMEEFACTAAKALVGGAVETMTQRQSQELAHEQACPGCGKACSVEHRPRSIQVRGGKANLTEPVAHCPACRRDFFPSASDAQDR